MSDLNFQNFSTVQNELQPGMVPVSQAALTDPATLTPTSCFTSIESVNGPIGNIVPPVSGAHLLCIYLDTDVVFDTGGNIATIDGVATNKSLTSGTTVIAIYNDKTKQYALSSLNNGQTVNTNGNPNRTVIAGSFALDGANPTNLAFPSGFDVASITFSPVVTATGTGTTSYCTRGVQSDANVPVYAWDKAGGAATDTPNVDYIAFGSF